MEKEVTDILKSKEYREHLKKVMTETFESPLFQAKIQDILLKAAAEIDEKSREREEERRGRVMRSKKANDLDRAISCFLLVRFNFVDDLFGDVHIDGAQFFIFPVYGRGKVVFIDFRLPERQLAEHFRLRILRRAFCRRRGRRRILFLPSICFQNRTCFR